MSDQKQQAERIARIEANLENLKDVTFGIQEEIKVMNRTLAVNTKQLEIHIEGVKLAREQNDILRKDVDARFSDAQDELAPIKEHVSFVNKTFRLYGKIFGYLIALPACIYYCINIYFKLKGQQ